VRRLASFFLLAYGAVRVLGGLAAAAIGAYFTMHAGESAFVETRPWRTAGLAVLGALMGTVGALAVAAAFGRARRAHVAACVTLHVAVVALALAARSYGGSVVVVASFALELWAASVVSRAAMPE
jgi:hypothetical protein